MATMRKYLRTALGRDAARRGRRARRAGGSGSARRRRRRGRGTTDRAARRRRRAGTMAQTVSADGTVAAAQTDDLSFTSAGHRHRGQREGRARRSPPGEVLATIDSAELAAGGRRRRGRPSPTRRPSSPTTRTPARPTRSSTADESEPHLRAGSSSPPPRRTSPARSSSRRSTARSRRSTSPSASSSRAAAPGGPTRPAPAAGRVRTVERPRRAADGERRTRSTDEQRRASYDAADPGREHRRATRSSSASTTPTSPTSPSARPRSIAAVDVESVSVRRSPVAVAFPRRRRGTFSARPRHRRRFGRDRMAADRTPTERE